MFPYVKRLVSMYRIISPKPKKKYSTELIVRSLVFLFRFRRMFTFHVFALGFCWADCVLSYKVFCGGSDARTETGNSGQRHQGHNHPTRCVLAKDWLRSSWPCSVCFLAKYRETFRVKTRCIFLSSFWWPQGDLFCFVESFCVSFLVTSLLVLVHVFLNFFYAFFFRWCFNKVWSRRRWCTGLPAIMSP